MQEAGLEPDNGIAGRVAVVDCNEISAISGDRTDQGDPLNTLWGVIAYQLGGQESYELIGDAARQWVAPSVAEIRRLLDHVGPCVVLIDELVAYGRNIPDDDKLGKFLSFIHYLTVAVTQVENVALVITLPESEQEAGNETGQRLLESLETITARIEATWHPLEARETYEVIRRRLFDDDINDGERERTCDAFSKMYRRSPRDFPVEASETRYLDRLRECYPIHPEIFDRVFTDWASNSSFQRTRGVLRVMAAAVSRLYSRQDNTPMIMPGSLPLDDSQVSDQFFRLLDNNWDSAHTEIDSDNGKLDEIDNQVARFKDVGNASRRLARTIFLGSTPGMAIKGLDIQQINLGTVKPGDGVANYRDALSRMSGSLYHLYEEGNRYFFHYEENLNRLASDRIASITDEEAYGHIKELLRECVPYSYRLGTLVCPSNASGVPDVDNVRLVVMPPDKSLPSRESEKGDQYDANVAATAILTTKAFEVARIHRNTIVFLTAQRDRIRSLARTTKSFLAWDSIVHPVIQVVNLEGERGRLATRSLDTSKRDMIQALAASYTVILSPEQPDGQVGEYRMGQHFTDGASTNEIISAAFTKLKDEDIVLDVLSPSALLQAIDGSVWKDSYDHISIRTLWNIMTDNVHMPFRLLDRNVLYNCINIGVQQGLFGYDDVIQDTSNNLYPNIRLNDPTGAIDLDGVLVRKEMAELIIVDREEKETSETAENVSGDPLEDSPIQDDSSTPGTEESPARVTRLAMAKILNASDFPSDLAMISSELIRNLFDEGDDVTVRVQITATKPDGFSENTTRSVSENSDTLGVEYSPEND